MPSAFSVYVSENPLLLPLAMGIGRRYKLREGWSRWERFISIRNEAKNTFYCIANGDVLVRASFMKSCLRQLEDNIVL